jgi:hypothetical protein
MSRGQAPSAIPTTHYVAQELKSYLMTRGQELLASKYGDVIRPVKGCEDEVRRAWEALARLG